MPPRIAAAVPRRYRANLASALESRSSELLAHGSWQLSRRRNALTWRDRVGCEPAARPDRASARLESADCELAAQLQARK